MIHYRDYEPEILKKVQGESLSILNEFIRICDKYDIKYFGLYGTNIGAARHQGFIPWDDDIDVGMMRDEYEKFIKVAPKEIGNRFGIAAPDFGENYYSLTTKFYKKGTRFCTLCDHGNFNLGIYIDIFVYDYIPEDEKLRKKQIKKADFYRGLYLVSSVNFYSNEMFKDNEMIKRILFGFVYYFMKLIPNRKKLIYHFWKKNATKYYDQSTYVTQFSSTMIERCVMNYEDTQNLVELPYENIKVKFPAEYDAILTKLYGNYMEFPPENERQNHYPYLLDLGDGLIINGKKEK